MIILINSNRFLFSLKNGYLPDPLAPAIDHDCNIISTGVLLLGKEFAMHLINFFIASNIFYYFDSIMCGSRHNPITASQTDCTIPSHVHQVSSIQLEKCVKEKTFISFSRCSINSIVVQFFLLFCMREVYGWCWRAFFQLPVLSLLRLLNTNHRPSLVLSSLRLVVVCQIEIFIECNWKLIQLCLLLEFVLLE